MRSTASTRVVALFVAALVVLAVAGLSAYGVAERMVADARWVAHTRSVLEELEVVASAMKDAQRGERGFILTGEERFAAPFRVAERSLPKLLATLRTRVEDNPAQLAQVGELERMVDEHLQLLGASIALRSEMGFEPAAAAVRAAEEKRVMDASSALIGRMREVEERLLAEREASAAVSALWMRWGVAGSSLLALLLVGAAVAQIRSGQLRLARSDAERRQSEERYRRLVESVRDYAIFQLDRDGRIASWSPGAEQITGYPEAEIVGRPVAVLHPDSELEVLDEALRSASRDGRHVTQGWRVRRDGSRFWADVVVTPLVADDGRLMGFSKITRDITERKHAQDAAERAKREADAAREEAERANRAKSEFLSRMSHELRTPMNSILGFAQLLEMSELAEEDRESVTEILRSGRHLLELINEVLDISRVEAGRLVISSEPVRVGELVTEVLAMVRPLAAMRQVQLAASPPPCDRYVRGDRQRLRQVLLNLLSNAIKYNRSGGLVDVGCLLVEGDRLRVEITDTGPGIAPAGLARLFEPFERLDADHGPEPGTGLGLVLSKGLLEVMGGELGVRSAPGEGSTFWFELPLVEGPVEHFERTNGGAAEPEPVAGAVPRTILCIEDNAANLRLIERILARRPELRLLAAVQGWIGLQLAVQHRPDLILLDLHLPDTSGAEVLQRLRAEPATVDIPIIVVSADATPGQIQRMQALGADGFLSKPLHVADFMATLDGALPPR